MSEFINIIGDVVIFIVVIVLVALTASYAAAAAAHITNIPDWASNPKLASAHKYLAWAASVGWIFIGLVIAMVILIIILMVTGGGVGFSGIIGGIITITNFLMIGILLAIGILAAIGTSDIDQSGVSSPEATIARSKALTATLISLGVLGGLLVYYVISAIIKSYQKKKKTEEAAAGLEELFKSSDQEV